MKAPQSMSRLIRHLVAVAISAVSLVAAPKILPQAGGSFVVETPAYRASVASDGCLTNLKIGGQEFLLPGVDISRGTYFHQGGVLALSRPKRTEGGVLESESPAARIRYAFADTGMTWTLENRTQQTMRFYAILPASIDLATGPDGVMVDMPVEQRWLRSSWFGEDAKLSLSTTGSVRQWGWRLGSTVWEAALKPGETRVVELRIAPIGEEERAALVRAKPSLGVVRLDTPRELEVFQRGKSDLGVVRVAGRSRVSADQVRWRLTGRDRHGKELDGRWKEAPVGPDGAFAASDQVPAGGWYALDLRVLKGGEEVSASKVAQVGVGEVFVGAGQSNSTSCGGLGTKHPLDGRHKPLTGKVSAFDGHSWRIADDPQPGAHDGHTAGSFWPAFGDAMVARFGVPIGVAVTGHGGTSIKAWRTDGTLFKWTLARVEALESERQGGKRSHPGFRALLWHQGESDAKVMDGPTYAAGLGKIIADMRRQAGWEFPWFVAQATYHPGQPPYAGVRAGQKSLWESGVALEGPDTDSMVGELRDNGGKGIHFSLKGLKVHGEAWAQKVGDWLERELAKEK